MTDEEFDRRYSPWTEEPRRRADESEDAFNKRYQDWQEEFLGSEALKRLGDPPYDPEQLDQMVRRTQQEILDRGPDDLPEMR